MPVLPMHVMCMSICLQLISVRIFVERFEHVFFFNCRSVRQTLFNVRLFFFTRPNVHRIVENIHMSEDLGPVN